MGPDRIFNTENQARNVMGCLNLVSETVILALAGVRVDPVECDDSGKPLCNFIEDPYCPMIKEHHHAGTCGGANEGCGFCQDAKNK